MSLGLTTTRGGVSAAVPQDAVDRRFQADLARSLAMPIVSGEKAHRSDLQASVTAN